MFEFLFKKQFKEFELTKTELYSLRSRVLQLEKEYHDLVKSVESDKSIDRNLHELNSSEIKDLTQRIDNLEKLRHEHNLVTSNTVAEKPKKRVGRPKKSKESTNE